MFSQIGRHLQALYRAAQSTGHQASRGVAAAVSLGEAKQRRDAQRKRAVNAIVRRAVRDIFDDHPGQKIRVKRQDVLEQLVAFIPEGAFAARGRASTSADFDEAAAYKFLRRTASHRAQQDAFKYRLNDGPRTFISLREAATTAALHVYWRNAATAVAAEQPLSDTASTSASRSLSPMSRPRRTQSSRRPSNASSTSSRGSYQYAHNVDAWLDDVALANGWSRRPRYVAPSETRAWVDDVAQNFRQPLSPRKSGDLGALYEIQNEWDAWRSSLPMTPEPWSYHAEYAAIRDNERDRNDATPLVGHLHKQNSNLAIVRLGAALSEEIFHDDGHAIARIATVKRPFAAGDIEARNACLATLTESADAELPSDVGLQAQMLKSLTAHHFEPHDILFGDEQQWVPARRTQTERDADAREVARRFSTYTPEQKATLQVAMGYVAAQAAEPAAHNSTRVPAGAYHLHVDAPAMFPASSDLRKWSEANQVIAQSYRIDRFLAAAHRAQAQSLLQA